MKPWVSQDGYMNKNEWEAQRTAKYEEIARHNEAINNLYAQIKDHNIKRDLLLEEARALDLAGMKMGSTHDRALRAGRIDETEWHQIEEAKNV